LKREGGGGRKEGEEEEESFGFLWSLLDAPSNVCVPIKFSTCSHHVPNAFFQKKLVPQFPIVFLQKNVPKRHQNYNKNIPLLFAQTWEG